MSDPPDRDAFLGIRDGRAFRLRERGSLFIAEALRVDSEGEAAMRLDAVRKREHAATHHCWASRLGDPERVVERRDDDGEPVGSAGSPILVRLRAAGVFDALVVVTRYFGGTKLGTGGLVRAYGAAAEGALAAAPRRRRVLESAIAVNCSFEDLGAVETALARQAADVLGASRRFEDGPELRIRLRRGRTDAFVEQLMRLTAGRAAVVMLGERDDSG